MIITLVTTGSFGLVVCVPKGPASLKRHDGKRGSPGFKGTLDSTQLPHERVGGVLLEKAIMRAFIRESTKA